MTNNILNNLQAQNQLKIKTIDYADDPNLQDTKKEEKSIVCWNCLTVLMVKPEWKIIQCPHCDKFNRVPLEEDNAPKSAMTLDDSKNHFDIVAPYVYALMTCPYCQTENKVRKEAEHVICYNCSNSFSIENPTIKCISSKQPITLSSKVARFSDVFFDPMVVPARYRMPSPMIIKSNCNQCSNNQQLMMEAVNTITNPPQPIPKPVDKYAAIRKLINDVEEIDSNRNKKFNKNKINYSMNGKKINSMPGFNINKNNSVKNLNSSLNSRSKAVYNMMFSNWNNSYI